MNLTMDQTQWLDDERSDLIDVLNLHELRAHTHVDQVATELPRPLGGTTLLGVQVDFRR